MERPTSSRLDLGDDVEVPVVSQELHFLFDGNLRNKAIR